MANCFQLCILTAEGTVLDTRAEYCEIPAVGGSVGILANHALMLCAIREGSFLCRTEDGKELRFQLPGGVAEIGGNSVTVLSDRAVPEQNMTERG